MTELWAVHYAENPDYEHIETGTTADEIMAALDSDEWEDIEP